MIYKLFKHCLWRDQFLFLAAIFVNAGAGQELTNDSLNILITNAKDHYYKGEYREAVSRFEDNIVFLKNDALLEAHKYLAFSYARLGQSERSSQHFRMIFKIDPRWKMDPEDSSPEIDPILIATKNDMAKEAGMCSCFIPGIGQIMKGEQKKGLILMSATSVSLALSISSWIVTDNRRHDYLAVGLNDSLRMNEMYDRYNDWYHISFASTAVFLGVYIYGICDAFSLRPNYLSANAVGEHGVVCAVGPASWRMGYEIRF